MYGRRLRSWALAGSAITLVVLGAAGWPAAPSRAQALAFPGVPAPGALAPLDRGAAQATPTTAAATATTAATAAAVATATAAATGTAAVTATSPAASPTLAAAAATTATDAPASPTATATGAAPAATATETAGPAGTATPAAAAATGTATLAATTAAAPTSAATRAATPTPLPTATVPVATSTAVMVVTPIAAPVAASTADVQPYMTSVAPSLQYYNGPNAQYPIEWYLQRHLGNPGQYTMYRTEPIGLCNTYYYQFQGVYYCYTGGAAAAMPDVLVPGMGVVPPSVLVPGAVPPGMAVGVVPGVMGGVVQTPTGYAVQSAWANVMPQYQYYYGPNYDYEYDWYLQRHLTQPWLYQVYGYDPGPACATYSYRYQDRFYCYTGGSVGALPPAMVAPPPGVAFDPVAAYALQAYWGQVDPNYWYYYGADYPYDDVWYQQRHLGNPLLYRPYAFEPVNECATYSYRYQDQYYCYTGMYTYSAGDFDWVVPVRYWSQVDPTYRYYYGPDYPYDDAWYLQRHLSYPSLYQPYDYNPGSECGTYYYTYQGLYYCYLGD